ncbi:hypothetical protein K503DRAFT_807224, partial [Rhizopogon vinicolor AM-OR11-026]
MSPAFWSRFNKQTDQDDQDDRTFFQSKISEKDHIMQVDNAELDPGELTFEEDAAGGMGRYLGVTSCTLLIVGKIIGTGIFSTPSSILSGVGS